MPVTLTEPDMRSRLKAKMQQAWSDNKAFLDESPKLPANAAALPRTFIIVEQSNFERGAGMVQQEHPFTITLQDLWPAGGSIHTKKTERVQAALDVLTAEQRFDGVAHWDLSSINYQEQMSEKGEPFYTVSINYSLTTHQRLTL